MTHHSLSVFLVGVVATISCLPSIVFSYSSPGAPHGSVNDFAQVLTVEERTRLETSVQAYEERTSREIAIVTVPTLHDETIESYAVKLFEEWGIGKRAEDNGVLILLAIQNRKVRIEVGYGLEPILTDAKSARLIEDVIPLLKGGQYYAALDRLTTGVELVLDRGVTSAPRPENSSRFVQPEERVLPFWEIVGILVLALLVFLVSARLFGLAIGLLAFVISYLFAVITGRPRPNFRKEFAGALSLSAFLGGISFKSGGGGFGGGSSGGGFGGGRSGGGGASGGW